MEYISRALFGIANSLLIPDIILLILFFLRALVLLGGTYNGFMLRRRNNQRFTPTVSKTSRKACRRRPTPCTSVI